MKIRRISSGVSLIEVLVVVAVIAVVLGLALPALSSARDAGRSTVCLSNVRSLGLALEMYKEQHLGRYPYADRPADVRDGIIAPYNVLASILDVSPPANDAAFVPVVQPFACPSERPTGPWSGFSYIYRPWDMMMLWPPPDPQLGVSRVLENLPQESILMEETFRHSGSGTIYRNDGATLMLRSRYPLPEHVPSRRPG